MRINNLNNHTVSVITIDGPSGVGKGSVALKLSQTLGFHILDSGAIYRLAALQVQNEQIDVEDVEALVACLAQMNIHFETGDELCIPFLNQQNVASIIRQDEIAQKASIIAAIPEVRAALLQVQRDFAQEPGLIADGRDMGTTVFSNAICKFYLMASAQERAKRRYKQLINMGLECNINSLLDEINARDERDMNRSTSPLKPAHDAIIVDTTSLSFDSVYQLVSSHVDETLNFGS